MAVIDKLYKSMGLPMNIKRGNPWPLDASSLWYSYDEMKAYAEDEKGVAYVGQVLALVDEAKGTAEAYIIADANGTLKPVGAGTVVDGKTIMIEEESDALGLKDFGKRFYKYIPEIKDEETDEVLAEASYMLTEVSEANPWAAGLEPRVVSENGALVLGWFEPNPTTIEGVNNQVSSIQSSVADLQAVTQNLLEEIGAPLTEEAPASGLYAELDKKANAADVYTKEDVLAQINAAVSAADHLQRKIVASYADITTFVDEKGAEEAAKYIFMVPEEIAEGNAYEEYMVINGVIEVVGKWSTDLSDYVTSEGLETALADYVSNDALTTKLTGYATVGVTNTLSGEIAEVVTLLDDKVDKEEGYSLISDEQLEKLEALDVNGEENYVKTVSNDFAVVDGELQLKTNDLDLSENTDFAKLISDIETLNTELSGVKTSVGTLSGNLDALQSELDANVTAVESLDSAVKAHASRLTALEEKDASLDKSLADLTASVNKNANDISGILTDLSNYVAKADYEKEMADIKDILTWKDMEEASN